VTTETKEERIGKRKEWMRTGDRRGRMVMQSRIFISDIVAICADVFDVTVKDIYEHDRRRHMVKPRRAVIYIATKHFPDLSASKLGALLKRDHSTVLHSLRTADQLMADDPDFSAMVGAIEQRIAHLSAAECQPVVAKHQLKASPARMVKPKNDFSAHGELDTSHLYQKRIARGSADLLEALQREMAV